MLNVDIPLPSYVSELNRPCIDHPIKSVKRDSGGPSLTRPRWEVVHECRYKLNPVMVEDLALHPTPWSAGGTMLLNCPPSQARSKLLHLLRYPRRLLLFNVFSSRDARHERCDVSCAPRQLDRSQPLLPDFDLSFMNNPGTPPEQLVIAAQNLKPFLPSGCEVLGEGDIKIPGPYPASGDGFAEMWIGEMKDGTKVTIKSQRRDSSSSNLSAFLVSCKRHTADPNKFSSSDVTYRGCIGKR